MTGPSGFAGVFGWPLTFTLSPAIHSAAFRACGVDWVYLGFAVPPESLPQAIDGARALGIMGANVTMPHKEEVVGLLDDLSGDARAIGAVNTIQRVGNRLIGHNTDVDGFTEFLQGDAGLEIEGRVVVVLGAGGAARSVVRALDSLGAERIVVLARRERRASGLREIVERADFSVVPFDQIPGGWDVLINSTPLGMNGEDAAPGVTFGPHQAVVDLVYWPPQTPLLERARAGGAQAWGGLGMLVRQAASSFTIWTGQDPPLETMSAVALHALRTRARQAH